MKRRSPGGRPIWLQVAKSLLSVAVLFFSACGQAKPVSAVFPETSTEPMVLETAVTEITLPEAEEECTQEGMEEMTETVVPEETVWSGGENQEPAETLLEQYLRGQIELPEAAELDAEAIRQNPELPTGCESVALTTALRFLGFDLEKTTIAKEYLIYDYGNYAAGYVGNPFSDHGAGIFAPGLTETANSYLAAMDSDLAAYDISGTEFEELYAYLAAGYPVILWTTMYFETPDFNGDFCEYEGRIYEWYLNEHCVMMSGYRKENGTVTVCDPLQGKVKVKEGALAAIYEATEENAVVIYR